MSAISREEREELAKAINRFSSKADALLGATNENSASVTVNQGHDWQMTVCLLLAVFGSAMGLGGMLFALDARSEMRSNNTNRERDIGELRQTDNAIRAYINTGVLKPKGAK